MKTTLSAGKRLADDEAARLLDAANGRVNEGGGDVEKVLIVSDVVRTVDNEQLREQIAEFAKAVTESMGKGTAFDSQWTIEHAINWAKGGENVAGTDKQWAAAEQFMQRWDESGATMQSLEEIRGTDDVSKAVFRLRQSVVDFHERYGTASKPNAVQNQAKAAAQEMGEYVWAVAAGDLEGAAKEAADVLYTVFGVAMLAGITREQLADAMYAIAASNDAKTVANGWDWNARDTKVEKLK